MRRYICVERNRSEGFWPALSKSSASGEQSLWNWLKDITGAGPDEAELSSMQTEAGSVRSLPLLDVIAGKSRFSSYRPKARSDMEAHTLRLSGGGEYVILKNPELHKYLKLTCEEYYLFTLMDGARTVQELVVAYFMKFHILAHERVAGLIRELEREGYLTDRPLDLWSALKEKISGQSLTSLAEKAGNIFFNTQVSLKGLDGTLAALYRSFFFLFFTKPALLLYPFICIAGVICFFTAFISGSYQLFETSRSYALGALTLFLIGVFRITLHEGSHAFATKWCGREVHRGGFLFYMGVPSFFADTSDIWLGSRRERILVSWAGPYSEIILSSTLSIIIVAFPSFHLSDLFFKIAFVGYISAFLNLNPLLELDGYFMLMDWLEIPNLRKRSLEFLKTSLIPRLKKGSAFTAEERIFTLFGIMCAVWTIVAIALSIVMLQWRMMSTLRDMFNSGGILARIMSGLAFIFFVLPLLISVLAMLYLAGRRALLFLVKWPPVRDVRAIAAAALLGAVAVSAAVSLQAQLQALSWGISIVISAAIAAVIALTLRDLAGSSLIDELAMKLVFSIFLVISSALGAFIIPEPFLMHHGLVWGGVIALFCASMAFFAYAYRFFLNFEFSLYSAFERFAVGAFLPVSVMAVAALGSFFFSDDRGSPYMSFLFTSALGTGIMSLALLIPLLGNYSVTFFFIPFLFEGAAITSLLLYYFLIAWHFGNENAPPVMIVHPGLFSLSLLLAGVLLFRYVYRRRDFVRPLGVETSASGDREKLFTAFRVIIDSLLANFRNTFGERRAQRAVRDFNGHSAAQGWNLVIRGWHIECTAPFAVIVEMQHPLASACDCLRSLLMEMTGGPLMNEYFTRVYDLLYWEEREVADMYLFSSLPWSRSFVRSPEYREDILSFLVGNPLFFDLDKEEVSSLIPILQLKRYMAGQVIVRQGDRGDEFFMIRSGRARVCMKTGKGVELALSELRRGDFFGEKAILEGGLRTATVKASTELETLVLGRADFERYVKERRAVLDRIRASADGCDLLERIPLFSDLTRYQLHRVYSRLLLRRTSPGETVISQGDEGEEFYIIRKGEFSAHICEKGRDVTLASMGEGEYFGEIALLQSGRRTASVKSCGEGELYVLIKKDFEELLGVETHAGSILRATSSRRLRSEKRVLHGGKSSSV